MLEGPARGESFPQKKRKNEPIIEYGLDSPADGVGRRSRWNCHHESRGDDPVGQKRVYENYGVFAGRPGGPEHPDSESGNARPELFRGPMAHDTGGLGVAGRNGKPAQKLW